jgi:hypothetical protein
VACFATLVAMTGFLVFPAMEILIESGVFVLVLVLYDFSLQ